MNSLSGNDSRMVDTQSSDGIAIIGAGMSGIAMAVQLKRILNHHNFVVYEKHDDVGGTWSQNHYPNLSCDIASENPDWSEKFAPQQEILDYIRSCVRHYRLEPHLNLQQECTSIVWSEEESIWRLSLTDLGSRQAYTVKMRYVVTAMGVLHFPNGLDDLPILRNFGGQCFHTAQWRDIDFDNKKILVIGNGCSANQVIPWILSQRHPKSMVQIVRGEQWVMPKSNYRISLLRKWCFRYVPFAMRVSRLWTAFQLDLNFLAFRTTPAGNKARRTNADSIKSYMETVANPRYHDILIPQYELGAKRPVMDHGYLQATNHSNFTLIKCDGLRSIEGSTRRILVDQAGNRHEVDIVIMANGFKAQDLLIPMDVIGVGGKDLKELWRSRGGSEAYMGVSVSGFPNFFMLGGPNTLASGNSALPGIECSIVYITRLLRGVWTRNGGKRGEPVALDPTPEAVASYNTDIQKRFKDLVYTSKVRTHYINEESGKNTLIWPGTQFSFWWSRCILKVHWSDWNNKHT